ncbi:hypothetical protein B0H12DRAFT_1017440 [Mycena haematopus]|nr:hypothetical protein B0H12DRAFT_1017440 [Mycena haematopus]
MRSVAAPLFSLSSSAPAQYLENAVTARFMNQQFANMAETDACTGNATVCINGSFAMCVEDAWVLTPCASGLVCAAVPQSSTLGVVLSCDNPDDISQRFAFAGVDSALNATTASDCDNDAPATSTSALPATSISSQSAAATSLAVRRFHPRQIPNVRNLSYLESSLKFTSDSRVCRLSQGLRLQLYPQSQVRPRLVLMLQVL